MEAVGELRAVGVDRDFVDCQPLLGSTFIEGAAGLLSMRDRICIGGELASQSAALQGGKVLLVGGLAGEVATPNDSSDAGENEYEPEAGT